MVFEAGALEVLHGVLFAVYGVDLAYLLGDGIAELGQAAIALPVSQEAGIERMARFGEEAVARRRGEWCDGREGATRSLVCAQPAQQHVIGRLVFGVELEAVALEVLHGVPALGELLGERVAKDGQA